MFFQICRRALPLLLASPLLIAAIDLDVNDDSSIESAAKTIAKDLLSYYKGDEKGSPVGLFPEEYYWWESGAVWSSLIDYWAYTGDDQYNDLVTTALAAQQGPGHDFMPPNQTKSEGNDDQGFWALAAMNAAEKGFPAASDSPGWIDLAQNSFDKQVARWDTESCKGGLRWQIFAFNTGYDYKNSASNGMFFQLAARLASFTGNSTYSDWAEKSYKWTKSIGLISDDYSVFDGAQTAEDCGSINKLRWSYVAACFVYGSAVMYNHTSDSNWRDQTNNLLEATQIFFNHTQPNGVMSEVACEPHDTCNSDMYAFKGLTAQWLGAATQIAPFTSDAIMPSLTASAKAAAKQCSGGKSGTACGSTWNSTKSDGNTGLGQELSAMNVVLANMVEKAAAPATANTTNATSLGVKGGNGQSSDPSSTGSATPASPTGSGSAGLGQMMAGNLILCSVLAAALFFLTI